MIQQNRDSKYITGESMIPAPYSGHVSLKAKLKGVSSNIRAKKNRIGFWGFLITYRQKYNGRPKPYSN